MKKPEYNPTGAELEVLQILWKDGPATVRFVNDILNQTRKVGYTTTLKIMQIMFDKGILKRNEESRSHLYFPLLKEQETQNVLLKNLLQTAFGGSAMKLVVNALGNHNASKEEIAQIKKFMDSREGEKK